MEFCDRLVRRTLVHGIAAIFRNAFKQAPLDRIKEKFWNESSLQRRTG